MGIPGIDPSWQHGRPVLPTVIGPGGVPRGAACVPTLRGLYSTIHFVRHVLRIDATQETRAQHTRHDRVRAPSQNIYSPYRCV